MDFYLAKAENVNADIALDDLFLTKALPTTAGSKMLEGFISLFDAEVLTRLTNAGYSLAGKAAVGEFAIDLLGETCHFGSCEKDGKLLYAPSQIAVEEGLPCLCLDVNGAPARGAAQSGAVYLKPTYGTVSRFGIVGVASSGETVGITAKDTDTVKAVLSVIAGHDDKDGTSLAEELCAKVKEEGKAQKVAVLKNFADKAESDVQKSLEDAVALLKESGIDVVEIDAQLLAKARIAWNILMSAETCNNVSRFDGVKYGYRAQQFTNIDELYTNSRTEAFGDLIKTCILFGSETLSTDNYMSVYDKAMRIRRLICEEFASLFKKFDALLLPAASKSAYSVEEVKANPELAYEENLYTAPAAISGLPAMVCSGVQFIGNAFEEGKLFSLAKAVEKEGK